MTQEEALEKMLSGKNCFLTGKAGTGKTYVTKKFIDASREKGKEVVVVAPTGIAAINAGGATIHSTFKLFGNYPMLKPVRQQMVDWEEIDIVVIDEISMVGPDYVDQIDYVLQECRMNDEPFGGIQMVFVGDPKQLPPVYAARTEEEKTVMKQLVAKYGELTFDKAKAYEGFETLELEEVKRTSDPRLVELLNRVRDGDLTALSEFNSGWGGKETVHLKPYNVMADKHNDREFQKLKGPVKRFVAKIAGKFNVKNVLTPEILELKEGAKVMVTRNLACGLVNGDMGHVVGFEDKGVVFYSERFKEEMFIKPETWEEIEYVGADETVVGTFTQVPMKLAWALTIHKSQGLTLDSVCLTVVSTMDQKLCYVGVSRCTTFDKLFVNKAG